jgi:hypothetical protein
MCNPRRHVLAGLLKGHVLSAEIILETRGLTKEFKGFVAVN